MLDLSKLPTPRKLQQIIKRLTPEQLKLLQPQIREVGVQLRRSEFKLIRGGRRTRK